MSSYAYKLGLMINGLNCLHYYLEYYFELLDGSLASLKPFLVKAFCIITSAISVFSQAY